MSVFNLRRTTLAAVIGISCAFAAPDPRPRQMAIEADHLGCALSRRWHDVENHAGAGGNIGSDFVAKAAPYGYTILGGTNANVLVVSASRRYKPVQDLTAAAKAKSGSISLASVSNGTSQHLSGERYKSLA